MVRVRPPTVRMFVRERQPVIDGGYLDLRQLDDVPIGRVGGFVDVHVRGRGAVRVARHYTGLVVLDQPIVVAAIRVPDDVIEDDQALELQLELLRHAGG